ncbi:MAG TPA: FAD-dependent oxidoreductase [Micromonospora sp.]
MNQSTNGNGPPQVLVVGAGPVGLVAAYELARRGVRIRLIDAASGPATTSRALATHARSLEIYDQMGVIEELMPRGRRIQAFTMHQRGRQLARMGVDYSHLPTRYPLTLMIDQAITEEVMRECAARHGVKVEWGVRLTGLRQEPDSVIATLTHAGGEVEEVTVPWLVGCDGGHSTVRKLLGLPLIGDSSETWLIADAIVDIDLPQDSIHWFHAGKGTMMLVPFPDRGKWRLLDTVDVHGADNPAEVAARFSRKLSRAAGRPANVHLPTWISVFTIQQRLVPRMSVGRCFVAGDAAHVHSPASGQGLNTGIQDAYNLAWKLAMVVQGYATEKLLDSYSIERVPIGERLLSSTETATSLVALKSALMAITMPLAFAVVRNVPAIKHRIERKIMSGMSALPIHYATSPLTVPGPKGGPRPAPGERVTQVSEEEARTPGWQQLLAELRDTRWTLLADATRGPQTRRVLARLADAHSGWLSVRSVTASPDSGVPGELVDAGGELRNKLLAGGWMLIRPDGYLAARGPELSEAALAPALRRIHLRDTYLDAIAGQN